MIKPALASFAFASLALSVALPAGAQDAEQAEKPVSKGEAELAELLDGYVAGEPVRCLTKIQQDRLRVIDDTALVFRDRRTIFVNRTSAPRYLDDFDIPVFKKFGSRLCKLDQVEMLDRGGNFAGPLFRLQEFIPYTKVETES